MSTPVTTTAASALQEALAAMHRLQDALDQAQAGLSGYAADSIAEARGQLGYLARRIRNVALLAGADPAELERA